jgi:hypothetical protein
MALDIDNAGPEEIHGEAKRLVDGWCDRRCLRALRHALTGWPMMPLTDGWAAFMDAMKNVRANARDELTPAELEAVDDLIRIAERAVYRHR